MSSISHTTEAVRVKVKKCEPNLPQEWRKFSVDPQITTLEHLYSLLAKAFEIKSDFSIKYKAYDPAGNEIYLSVLSDWDLDAAFLRIHNIAIQTATEPSLTLQIDVKPFTEVKEFDAETPPGGGSVSNTVIGAKDLMQPLQQSIGASQKYVQHMQHKLPGLIMNQMEKTFSIVQKAFNLSEETMATLPPRIPVSDTEFRLYHDALGQIQRNDELRKAIFLGGIDPSLRRVVWKHLLNVYPSGMNGIQRMDYMKKKSEHYFRLRDTWKTAIKEGCVNSELAYVTSMVKKDVLRTDRLHPFYAGSDDNQNIASLFNILTTYALNHPTVSYCQGMSDIASPLLVTMNDEAQAYICFCAIMSRLKGNFMLDGIAMTQKFAHLTEALSFYDPEFWDYLKSQQADDLLFCYRWLLLELKREFPFEDALRMLEVQWSSLKYPNCKDLSLFEKEFEPEPVQLSSKQPPPQSPSYLLNKPRENAYTKVCALRRQSSSVSLSSLSSSYGTSSSAISNNKLNQSLDETITKRSLRRRRRVSSKAHQSLDETKMLMLIEGIEKVESKSESKSTDVTLSDVTDDEVFSATQSPALDVKQFNFHPTNPFLEDAQQKLLKKINKTENPTKLASDRESEDKVSGPKLNPTPPIPKSIVNLQNKNIISNYNTVSNIIAKQINNANNVSETIKRVSGTGGGHFKELKDKLAASNKRGFSIDDISNEKSQQKLVKNFNEFLNFASKNKNKISDKFTTTPAAATPAPMNNQLSETQQHLQQQQQLSKTPSPSHPLVQLTRSGYNSSFESDTSSMVDATWSNSTAPTAFQQGQTFSSHSLQLELNSLPYTPDRTPTLERKEDNHKGKSQEDSTNRNKNESELNLSPGEEQDYFPMSTEKTRELQLNADKLDRQIFGESNVCQPAKPCMDFDIEYEKLDRESIDLAELDLKDSAELMAEKNVSDLLKRRLSRDKKPSEEKEKSGLEERSIKKITRQRSSPGNPFLDEVALLSPSLPLSDSLPEIIVPVETTLTNDDVTTPIEMARNAADELAFSKSPQRGYTSSPSLSDNYNSYASPPALPPPHEFGGGNPFLIFLCLTLLLQHRNTIMKSNMDYNEIAMHFDKMIRKHDVIRVLNQARRMYIEYLKMQNMYKQQLQEQRRKSEQNSSERTKTELPVSGNRSMSASPLSS